MAKFIQVLLKFLLSNRKPGDRRQFADISSAHMLRNAAQGCARLRKAAHLNCARSAYDAYDAYAVLVSLRFSRIVSVRCQMSVEMSTDVNVVE